VQTASAACFCFVLYISSSKSAKTVPTRATNTKGPSQSSHSIPCLFAFVSTSIGNFLKHVSPYRSRPALWDSTYRTTRGMACQMTMTAGLFSPSLGKTHSANTERELEYRDKVNDRTHARRVRPKNRPGEKPSGHQSYYSKGPISCINRGVWIYLFFFGTSRPKHGQTAKDVSTFTLPFARRLVAAITPPLSASSFFSLSLFARSAFCCCVVLIHCLSLGLCCCFIDTRERERV
jgi:hypothetical protein